MAFDELVDRVNDAVLAAFGEAYSFTPAETGIPQTILGVLIRGVELEQSPPGEGSINAVFWTKDDVVPSPKAGDEISSATAVYKVLLPERDEEGGLTIQLRQDRMI